MVHTHLITGIAAELREATKEIKLRTEYATVPSEENFVKVNVFEEFIPDDLFEQTSYYPLIIVEWLETSEKLTGADAHSTATVGLSFGVFAKEEDAWKDCFHLMETCREWLLRRRVIAKRFRLTDEISWQAAPNQPRPFMFAYGELQYQIFQPQEVDIFNAFC